MGSRSFVDEAVIRVRSGDGGAGAASFHREKYRPRGGPDGGDGGRGGSVLLVADPSVRDLSAYRLRRAFRASDGGRGGSNLRRGADGEDLVLRVPVGTVVRDAELDEVLADLAAPGASYVVARGGRGGRGNAALQSAVQRAPAFAERGEPGTELRIRLDLRLVADVGLLGLPNAGKSTLLRALSAARPPVADYPFTTLEPYLGTVEAGEERFVVADLPGLVEGAAAGRGLGTRFLRHASRCGVLAAVVDLARGRAEQDLETVRGEAAAYDVGLADRIRVVVGNKIDLEGADPEPARRWAEERGAAFVAVSAQEGTGIGRLVEVLAAEVERASASRPPAATFAVFRPLAPDRVTVEREGEALRVRSRRAERLVAMTPLGDPQAVRYLQRRLRSIGVEAALRRHGVQAGQEVRIGEAVFEYQPEER